MGVTALEDPEGLHGDFRYTFWSSEGRELETVVLDEHRIGIPNEQGASILLLGASEAAAYRNDGTFLWTAAGRFRNGTLARAGEVALLNPVDAIDEVHIVRSGHEEQVLTMAESVYDIAITPDGSLGAVATGAGRIHVIDLRSCPGKDCRPRRLLPLPVLSTHYVTSLRFVSEHSLALGVIQAAGVEPYRSFYGAIVLVIGTTRGELQFRNSIKLPEPTTWSPMLDVTFGKIGRAHV